MIIKNGLVFWDNSEFIKKDLYIKDNIICEAGNHTEETVIDASDCYVIPGLIDIHLHGANGFDISNLDVPSPNSDVINNQVTNLINTFLSYELKNGITSVCPTTMSYDFVRLKQILEYISEYLTTSQANNLLKKIEPSASLIGINLEGPFLNPDKCGAQNKAYLTNPNCTTLRELLNHFDFLKLISISPELDGALSFIEMFHNDICISLAHTDCNYDLATKAFLLGATHLTHMGNAMNPMLSRIPGPIAAAFDNENVNVELITDSIHIHPAMVRLFFKAFGDERIVMISDSIEACGMPDGEYSLGGQSVLVNNKKATLLDGTIAGSTFNLMDCFKNAVKEINIPLESVIKCSTFNPAKAIGMSHLIGSINPGKIADLLILDQNLNLVKTIKNGVVYN